MHNQSDGWWGRLIIWHRFHEIWSLCFLFLFSCLCSYLLFNRMTATGGHRPLFIRDITSAWQLTKNQDDTSRSSRQQGKPERVRYTNRVAVRDPMCTPIHTHAFTSCRINGVIVLDKYDNKTGERRIWVGKLLWRYTYWGMVARVVVGEWVLHMSPRTLWELLVWVMESGYSMLHTLLDDSTDTICVVLNPRLCRRPDAKQLRMSVSVTLFGTVDRLSLEKLLVVRCGG